MLGGERINIILILGTLCSILFTSKLFVDTIIYPKWIILSVFIFIITILCNTTSKNKYRIDALYVFIFAFILYMLIHSTSFFSSCEYMFLFHLTGFFLLYSYFYFNKSAIRADYFHDALCLAGIVQSIIAIVQLLRHDLISGASDNSTGLAISLVSIFPFVYLPSRTMRVNWRKNIYVISSGLIILTVILSGCRTCIIALAVMISFMVCSKKYIVLLIGVSATLCLTVHYKKDSSKGRLFIYQTSLQMLNSRTLLFGKGHGGFKREYMYFQARSLKNRTQSSNAILADNVFHPLNEYLLLLIEHGIAGCILAFIVCLLLFKRSDHNSPHFLFVLALGIIACFSYPFQYPLTSVLLAYSLAAADCKRIYNLEITRSIKRFIILATFGGISYMLFDMRNNYLWKKQVALCSLGKIEKTLPKYNELYPNMNDDPYFLYNYSMVLFQYGNYQKSETVLLYCNQYLNDYDTELLHADISRSLKRFDKAEDYYIRASQMCPNRFQPLYQLMNLYKEIGKMEQVRLIAEMIVTKKVKIPSKQIDKIIQEANSFLGNHQ